MKKLIAVHNIRLTISARIQAYLHTRASSDLKKNDDESFS